MGAASPRRLRNGTLYLLIMHCTFFGLIPEGGIFFDPFSQHEFVKTSATTAVSSTEKDYIEDFHHNEMIVPIEDKGDERPE